MKRKKLILSTNMTDDLLLRAVDYLNHRFAAIVAYEHEWPNLEVHLYPTKHLLEKVLLCYKHIDLEDGVLTVFVNGTNFAREKDVKSSMTYLQSIIDAANRETNQKKKKELLDQTVTFDLFGVKLEFLLRSLQDNEPFTFILENYFAEMDLKTLALHHSDLLCKYEDPQHSVQIDATILPLGPDLEETIILERKDLETLDYLVNLLQQVPAIFRESVKESALPLETVLYLQFTLEDLLHPDKAPKSPYSLVIPLGDYYIELYRFNTLLTI